MRRTVTFTFVLGLATFCVGLAVAQNAAGIAARRAIYKEMGDATQPVARMLKKEIPFDLAVVRHALDLQIAAATRLPDMFPDDTKSGDTDALPAVWDKNAEFRGNFAKLLADATAARAGITDEASFAAVMPGVLQDCGTCHRSFRVRR